MIIATIELNTVETGDQETYLWVPDISDNVVPGLDTPIVKGGRFLHIKATYYNPIKRKKIKPTIKESYKLMPMALLTYDKCSNLNCHKEVIPHNIYIYIYIHTHVIM